jgi:hypothetical protein
MAAAAIALATPAFAQTGTVAATAPTTPAVSAPATPTAQPTAKTADVKTPDVKAVDKTTVAGKKDAMAKSDAKDTMKKSETTDKSSVKGKVSALHHHKTDKSAKTEKTVG